MREIRGISVIGLGKLGLCIAASFADKGFQVNGVDVDIEKIEKINQGLSPIEETGLSALIKKAKKNLSVARDTEAAVLSSDVSFIVVATPSLADGSFSNNYLEHALEKIGIALKKKRGEPEMPKILAVEDEKDQLNMLKIFFKGEGWEFAGAGTGEKALKEAAAAKPVAAEAAPAKTGGPRAGEQLQFEFMKGKPEPRTLKIAREPLKSRSLEFEPRKAKGGLAEPRYKQLELNFDAKPSGPKAKTRTAAKGGPKPGEQLEFQFMKEKPAAAKAAAEPLKARRSLVSETKAAKAKAEKPRFKQEEVKVKPKAKTEAVGRVKEGVLRRAGRYLLASGYIEPALKAEILKSDAVKFIHKPYKIEQIIVAVREALDFRR